MADRDSHKLTKFWYFDDCCKLIQSHWIPDATDLFFVGKLTSCEQYIIDSSHQLVKSCQTEIQFQPCMNNIKVNIDGQEAEIEVLFFGSMELCLGYCHCNFIESTCELRSMNKDPLAGSILEALPSSSCQDDALKNKEEEISLPMEKDYQSQTSLNADADSIKNNDSTHELDDISSNRETNNNHLEARLDLVEKKVDQVLAIINKLLERNTDSDSKKVISYKPERAMDLQYQAKLTKILAKVRYSDEWRAKIRSYEDNRLDADKLKQMKVLFLSGTNNATTFARRLGEIVFGQQVLEKTIMGKDGKPLKGIKRGIDRDTYFTIADEILMKDLMNLIDEALFQDADSFELLVRRPLNQLGRDVKKPKEAGQVSHRQREKKSRKVNVAMLPITSYFGKQRDENTSPTDH